jgi:hypothetical protein
MIKGSKLGRKNMQEICLAPRQVRKEGALLKRGSQNDFLEELFRRIRLRAS